MTEILTDNGYHTFRSSRMFSHDGGGAGGLGMPLVVTPHKRGRFLDKTKPQQEAEIGKDGSLTVGTLLSPLRGLKLSPIPDKTAPSRDHLPRAATGPARTSRGTDGPPESRVTSATARKAGSATSTSGGSSSTKTTNKVPASEKLKKTGQLKLSVYVNHGLLTIHVKQARSLQPASCDMCSSFIQLSLMPDNGTMSSTGYQTELVAFSNNPIYDEKCSFELVEEDMNRRLLVAVWNKDFRTGRNEILGCMSFGLRHIIFQKSRVNGWYYLLNKRLGTRKHLRASGKRESVVLGGAVDIPKINKDIRWMDGHTISIRCDSSDVGFYLLGDCPACVSYVTRGSVAEAAGLEANDCVVRVNGVNVSRSTAESVARLIREAMSHNEEYFTLAIQRPTDAAHRAAVAAHQPLSSTLRSSSGYHSDSEVSTHSNQLYNHRYNHHHTHQTTTQRHPLHPRNHLQQPQNHQQTQLSAGKALNFCGTIARKKKPVLTERWSGEQLIL